MLHPIGNEENIANHGKFQKKRGSSPATVLTHSRSHNLQASSTLEKSRVKSCRPGYDFHASTSFEKARVTSSKNGHALATLERAKKITLGETGSKPALNSVCKGNRLPHEKPEESPPPSSRAMRRNSGLCPAVKTRAMERKAPSESPEVDELKQKLHDANLRMAEVVAQSVILVQDIQSAASKEITDALSRAHTLNGEYSQTRNHLAGLERGVVPPLSSGRNLSTSFHSDMVDTTEHTFLPICSNCSRKVDNSFADATEQDSLSTGTSLPRNFHTDRTEFDLLSTRQELTVCRLMLAKMKQQLEQTTLEKERLESSLRSSVQTSLQLQKELMNQQSIMQNERLAFKEGLQNVEAACLIRLAITKAETCDQGLFNDATLPSECERKCMPRKYVELLHDLQRGLLSSSDQHSLELDLLQPNLQQEDQVHRVYLAEARAQVTFEWTVLECVWKGAVDSFLSSVDLPDEAKLMPSKYSYRQSHVQRPKWWSEEELTPVKDSSSMATPRSAFSEYRENACGRPSSHEPEENLRENLIKSQHQVEILVNNVEELKVILQKVTALLDYISLSSFGNGTQLLIRTIIDERRSVEHGFAGTPTTFDF